MVDASGPLIAVAVLSLLAAVVAFWTSAHLPIDSLADLFTYDGLRAAGGFCAWLAAWAMAALMQPDLLLNHPPLFVSLCFWAGVPLTLLQFISRVRRHRWRLRTDTERGLRGFRL